LEKKLTDYILLKAAERYLERMQPEDQLRIIKVLDALLLNPALLDQDLRKLLHQPLGVGANGHSPLLNIEVMRKSC
jgi:hypothetical protein